MSIVYGVLVHIGFYGIRLKWTIDHFTNAEKPGDRIFKIGSTLHLSHNIYGNALDP